jgi:hypothetical protein
VFGIFLFFSVFYSFDFKFRRLLMAPATIIRKRTTSVSGSSISAAEVQACFAKMADSPEQSKAFLRTIGVSVSGKKRSAKVSAK